MGRLPSELLAMPAADYEFLCAFMRAAPFGPLRDDLRAAEVVCATANVWGAGVRPADVFASLRPARPRGRECPAAPFVALCPALTPTPA